MPDYVVTHIWRDAEGEPYLRIVPGTVPHIDIAFYAADLITEDTDMPSAVYALDITTAEMIRQQRPTEPTMDPNDIPHLLVLDGLNAFDPPDLLTAPNEGPGGVGGVGLIAGTGVEVPIPRNVKGLATIAYNEGTPTTTEPADTPTEENQTPEPETTP